MKELYLNNDHRIKSYHQKIRDTVDINELNNGCYKVCRNNQLSQENNSGVYIPIWYKSTRTIQQRTEAMCNNGQAIRFEIFASNKWKEMHLNKNSPTAKSRSVKYDQSLW